MNSTFNQLPRRKVKSRFITRQDLTSMIPKILLQEMEDTPRTFNYDTNDYENAPPAKRPKL